MSYSQELDLALSLARQAGEIQLSAQLQSEEIDLKADASPVTVVDRACEALIRDGLLSAFPGDGFLGEESGAADGTSGRRWIVDPLDGTRPFIRGIATYSCLIALEDDGVPVVGVIHLPAMRETYWASAGDGAYCNGTPINVSSTPTLSDCMGSAFGYVQKQGDPIADKVLALMTSWDYAYGFMDAYTYAAIASGKLDLCVNLLDRPWDCAAGACLVKEAGGMFSDIAGNRSVHNGSMVLSNGLLHDQILDALV